VDNNGDRSYSEGTWTGDLYEDNLEYWSTLDIDVPRRLSENSRGLVKKQCIYE